MARYSLLYLPMILVAVGLGGCAIITSTPPTVGVLNVQLTALGITEQRIATTLCVTNPNPNTLSFKHVSVALDISGQPFGMGATDLPVVLPPQSSVAVPFTVVTTVQNLGPQFLGTLQNGSIGYRVHGAVTLQGSLGLVLPFSGSGQINPLTSGIALVASAIDPAVTPCTPVGR